MGFENVKLRLSRKIQSNKNINQLKKMIELSLHILDIVQNSIRAHASRIEIIIDEEVDHDRFIIEIIDNGDGMSAEQLDEASNPFFTTRTTRKVGLGISLLKQNAEQTGGSLSIQSTLGEGTRLKVTFSHHHVDRPILGDIAGTMTLLIGANPKIRFIYIHRTAISDFEFDTNEVIEELGGTPISHPDILKALKELINENLDLISGSIYE
jgi:anti-sigma regulatory factor (Ser/Thr protein kinase)